MIRICLVILMVVFSASTWADVDPSKLLNTVNLQLKAEKWVTTQTALIGVSVNASVNDRGIERIQEHVLAKLKQLSNRGKWHILNFNRSKDRSGLESVRITAQARLPQTELAALRSKAKSISKPGETYTVDQIQFTPSDGEIRGSKAELRKAIYDRAKDELVKLNKIYTDQEFYIHRIDFTNTPVIMPMAQAAMYRTNKRAGATTAPLNVGNKLDMVASVTLASMPESLAKKSPLIN